MKLSIRMLFFVLAFFATLLSACGSAPAVVSSAGAKVEAAEVAFTGVIEAMNGTQWVVNGQPITVDPALVRDGPFAIGDTVKVEARVDPDGAVTVTRVEAPNFVDFAAVPTTETPSGTSTVPLAGGTQDGLVFDDGGNEAFGSVDAIVADTVTIGGQTFTIASGAEFKNQVAAGDFVKVHFVINADGTLSITEIETWDPALVGDDNSNSNGNSSDDHSNDNDDDSDDDDDNSNDDHSDDDSNDDDSTDGGDNHGSDNGGDDD